MWEHEIRGFTVLASVCLPICTNQTKPVKFLLFHSTDFYKNISIFNSRLMGHTHTHSSPEDLSVSKKSKGKLALSTSWRHMVRGGYLLSLLILGKEFMPWLQTPITHKTGCWVCPRDIQDVTGKKITCCPCPLSNSHLSSLQSNDDTKLSQLLQHPVTMYIWG